MNIAICEDNPREADLICGCLREHFEKCGYIGDIQTFESGEALLDAFSFGAFDAVFLDIYMSGMTGMETAKKMRAVDSAFALVFITSSKEHTMEAFDLCACSYVKKPIERESIDRAFGLCQSVFIKNAKYIEVMSSRQKIKIPLIKIFYAEIYDKSVLLHTSMGEIETRMTLDELEQALGASFLRCHRAYVVNLNHVRKILEQELFMKNGDKIPIPQRSRSEIRDAHAAYISDRFFERESL